jgi:uncharacterized protein
MFYLPRLIISQIEAAINRGRSVLLLGARQTGKTTLIKEQVKPTIYYSLVKAATRQRYERNPSLLANEIAAEKLNFPEDKLPLIVIDEIQKVPILLDVVQDLVDNKMAQFILTGSSARKLKNLLPGRVVALTMDPLLTTEIPEIRRNLEDLLIYGSLPGIFNEQILSNREIDLHSYVSTYLEEEIRTEAVVRNVANFARFLELAANDSGNIVNFSKLSQEVGVTHTTITNYYQILEDCMVAVRIDALTKNSRKKLSKASKYIIFDLGLRRAIVGEGTKLPNETMGKLFEQFVGLELIRRSHIISNKFKIRYWRDHNGPEVDFVLDKNGIYTPVEVKWTDSPKDKDFRHLRIFLEEYKSAQIGYIICRTPKKLKLTDNIFALPWQELDAVI